MKLEDYVWDRKESLEDFLKLNKEQAIKFDFLTQGEEPDRVRLINEIYHKIFPWFDENEQAGDTLNTYRTAVKKFYGSNYRFLKREQQLEIIGIIKKYTNFSDNHLFEFEATNAQGQTYYQLCNNYQLGNFGILPIHGGVNPARATSPYLDFFNEFILALNDYYNGELEKKDKLSSAILKQNKYFSSFEDLESFLNDNFLNDFVYWYKDENEKTCYAVEGLSDTESFEEYVSMASNIITLRVQNIWKELHGQETDRNLIKEEPQMDDENPVTKKMGQLVKYIQAADNEEELKQ